VIFCFLADKDFLETKKSDKNFVCLSLIVCGLELARKRKHFFLLLVMTDLSFKPFFPCYSVIEVNSGTHENFI